ncbi:DUF3376 domain-containing protein [Arthrobacter sp. FW305-BF8]|uniref:DUF3376 domain-containing protein n=1 Tax=Arthrobacter sp. FW305-BF8 TaxID=2879617 RepID=UPI001F1FB2A6|nr:DUF3376 domain-containing protein [Arthrobacter sp. FW305-BF8]UKA52310.1 DUF3376 domain-containing protein [Arthrobacter sp. FW305-BF8]
MRSAIRITPDERAATLPPYLRGINLPRGLAEIYVQLQQAPGDPTILQNLAAAVDAEASAEPAFRKSVERFVRERQRPQPVRLQVLGPAQTPDGNGLTPAFGRTLRIALAMRGGVSLAVWIGGCVAELDILRRLRICRPEESADPASDELTAFYLSGTDEIASDPLAAPVLRRAQAYASLLVEAQYDRVEIDILAGASAGGLNCILYAVAQMVGAAPDETILKTWQRDGGLQELMRPPGLRRVKSILRGDEYFFPRIRQALERIYSTDHRHESLVPEHLTIDLSATVLDNELSRNPDVQEGRGSFHFEGRNTATGTAGAAAAGPVPGNRIPARNGPDTPAHTAATAREVAADLARLAYAARSTSSFPGAFEPATIYSMEGSEYLHPPPDQPDMRHAFGSHRSSTTEREQAAFHVVDGGVFDNIPIGRALTAARGRVSPRPAHRALLYLDPDAVRDPVPVSRNENISQFVNAVGASLLRLKRRESLDSEVNQYVDYVNTLSLNLGRSEALAAVLSERWCKEVGLERRRAYVRYRATSDVDMLTQLLTRPDEWQVASTATDRRNFRARGSDELGGFDSQTGQVYQSISRQDEGTAQFQLITADAQALLDAAQCAFSWLRRIETESFPEQLRNSLTSFDELRAGVYGVINNAVAARDKAFWAVLDRSSDCEPGVLHEEVISAWLSAAESDRPDLSACWNALQSHLDVLIGYSANLTARAEDASRAEYGLRGWLETPWPHLARMVLSPSDGSRFSARDLAPALAAAGIPPVVARIRYWRIGSDEKPGHAEDYALLKDGEHRSMVAFVLRNPQLNQRVAAALLDSDPADVPSLFKLAGNTLANFSGFLSREWRENDWWWGRLDAASGISRFLETLSVDVGPRIPELDGDEENLDEDADEPPHGSRNRVSWLQDRVTEQQFRLTHPSPESRRTARQSIRAGADRPSDLSASYRLLLMSRGLRVLWRARPDGKLATTLGGWLLHVLLVPLFTVLPAVVHPARLAFILGFGYAGLWVLTRPEDVAFGAQPLYLYPWLALPGVLFLILAAVALNDGWHRWGPVLAALAENPSLALRSRDWQAAASRRAFAGPLAVTLLLVPLALAASQARQLMVISCLAFMAGLVIATRQWAMSVPALIHGKHPRLDQALATAGLLLAVFVPLVTELMHWSAARDWQSLVVLAGALLVVALALTCDWLTLPGALLTGVLAATAGPLAAWAVWGVLGTLRQSERTLLCLYAAVVVWGLVVWWLPEITRMVRHCSDAVVTVPRPVNRQ